MKIEKITITRNQLNLLPEKERVFFVQLGHFANELSVLIKLLVFSENKSDIEVVKKAYFMQESIVVRLSAGKLFEGWQLLQKNYFATKLSKKYDKILPINGQKVLSNLKKYFGTKNVIADIRNNFSFHNPSFDEVSKQLKAIPNNTEFELFIGEDYASTNYYMAEQIISNTMLNYVKKSTLQQAMNEIIKDLAEVSSWFLPFCRYIMLTFLDEFVGPSNEKLKLEEIEMKTEGYIKEITIPFFVKG